MDYLKAEISVSAIRANISALRGRLAPDVKVCAVVKCDCYGHGWDLVPIISELVDWLGVATPAEALHLRRIGYDGPVLVFFSTCTGGVGPNLAETLEQLLRERITLTITSRSEVEVLAAAAQRAGVDAEVHVMVDTGMTRSGIVPSEAPSIVEQIHTAPGMRMTGIYTHLATADESDKSAAHRQLRLFDQVLTACKVSPDSGILRHAANSAGVIDLPDSHYDMVRPGIAVYGYQPSNQMHTRLSLRPALRLTGHLMQVKAISAGTRCGYGHTHEFSRDGLVGLVPVGYGDGYLRILSNRATMRIGGRDVPICGRVSMDQTIADLTDLPEAAVGDEVEIFCPDPDAPHSVENLARLGGTISYEILTRLGNRVRRVLVE